MCQSADGSDSVNSPVEHGVDYIDHHAELYELPKVSGPHRIQQA